MSRSKFKHLKALDRKLEKNNYHLKSHSVPPVLERTRANRAYYTDVERLFKYVWRKEDKQGRFNIYRRRCLNNPPKFRWRNLGREVKREKRLAEQKQFVN